MAVGLAALLDDVAALAKLAAASVDDIGAAASKATVKAAGVVVDDAAVTPAYVQGLAADRELPIIRRIATGSLRNKLLFILPVALLLSAVAPTVVEIILMCGGAYLAYEGAHKVWHKLKADDHSHDVPVVLQGADAEKATISSAIRTDFILSAEIMVIALKEVIDEPLVRRGLILVIVGILITAVVYGAVALIVKMDDVGLRLAQRTSPSQQRMGRGLVSAMPKVLTTLSVVGTAAMLWVGGHILLAGTDELGWHGPYEFVHHLEEGVHDVGGIGGVLSWLVNTAMSALVGLVVGGIIVAIVTFVQQRRNPSAAQPAH
ncbi:MAG: DUF808 domain-containing protein [Actinomycetota bacterium]|nr:DUF808 domain-containing protein [Actinomycetota bacterium]